MRRDAIDHVHHADDAAAVMDDSKSPAKLAGMDSDPAGHVSLPGKAKDKIRPSCGIDEYSA
jgi:hypothetical protein